jgi:hypothetical protein
MPFLESASMTEASVHFASVMKKNKGISYG